MQDQRIRLADGRVVGFADYGPPAATAVLWCHGGPGSRIEPAHLVAEATRAGLRIIGIDRRFDAAFIQCPVTVLHGANDRIVDVIHASHTAELIPGAELVIFDDLGHFSITTKVVPAIRALLQR